MKRVVVLGAGISGLAAGWFLREKFGDQIELEIWDKSDRPGGWIRTLREGPFQFEAGPRGFRPSGKGEATLELVRGLGLEQELVPASRDARRRYLWVKGKLQPFSPFFLLRHGFLEGLLHDLWAPKGTASDETVADFAKRRLNQELADMVLDPLTKGIFGGDMRELSVRSCFPLLWKFEKEKGSILRGALATRKKKKNGVPLYTFRQGMETLPQALAHALKDTLRLNRPVHSWKEVDADLILSTLPHPEVAPYATMGLVHLGWNQPVLPLKGFGFLVPTREQEEILGMTWDSEIFPNGHQTRLCVMTRGHRDENALRELGLQSVQRFLKISTPPDVLQVTFAEQAIPQYQLHHEEKIRALRAEVPSHVKLLGTCLVGPGVNDCVEGAKTCVGDLTL